MYVNNNKTSSTFYNLNHLSLNPQFCPPQSLELGRAHKKASSIVNATIDPDKVTSPFDCRYAINS